MSNQEGPVIFRRSERLYLRPFEKSDLPHFVRWFNDPEVTENLSITRPMSMVEEEAWYEEQKKADERVIRLAVVLSETNKLIGNLGLHDIKPLHGTAVFGWVIGEKEHWGKGYGPEALKLLLGYAFQMLNLRKITAMVYDHNTRSQHGLEKCGFRMEARLKAQRYRNGRYVDELIYSLFREN